MTLSRQIGRSTGAFRNSIEVKYFEPNDTKLYAVVECRFMFSEIYPINAELIETSKSDETHITLEDINLT